MRQGLVRWGLLLLLALIAIVTPAGLSSLNLSPARDLPAAEAGKSFGFAELPWPREGPGEDEPMPQPQEPSAGGDGEAAIAPHSSEPPLEFELGLAGLTPERPKARKPSYVPGRIVILQPAPDASFEVVADGSLKFTAILVNESKEGLRLTGELILIKGDGTTETLLAPRVLRLKAGQRLQLPVELAVQAWGLPPGEVELLAILRDLQGAIVDKASINFKITLALER